MTPDERALMHAQERHDAELSTGPVFTARYHGRCAECDEPVRPGDLARYSDDGVVHTTCPDAMPDRPVTICDICHLTKPCDCEEDR